jgi:molybdopterin synthase sulfur carrier subunit
LVKVKVLYFASLRERVGKGSEEIDLPAGVATLGELRGHLIARGGVWETSLGGNKSVRMAVNQDMVPLSASHTAAINAGDEIAFFPPVTGG